MHLADGVKMLHKDEIRILRIVKLAPIFVAIVSLISISIVYQNNQIQFNKEVQELIQRSNMDKDNLIKSEVLRVYDFIKAKKALAIDKIKFDLKNRVREAHTIANAIYKNNRDKSDKQIKALINDALRDIRFNNGRGYFFIYETKGTNVLHPLLPHLENKNLWSFKDVKGDHIIQISSEIATKQGEGALTWWWKKPADIETEYEKVGYIKHFAPYDWFIGTGDYIVDYEEELKKELLVIINEIRYGKEGYIFIIDQQGVYLSHVKKSYLGQNRIDYLNPEGVAITRKIIDVAKSGEGFFSYVGSIKPSTGEPSSKRSFIKGFDDWQWAIGTGAYLNDIAEIVAIKKAALNEKNSRELMQIIILGAVVSLGLFLISLLFSNTIKRRFKHYQDNVNNKSAALNDLNSNLERLVLSRTTALEAANIDLEATLTNLQSTQSKLLESEKMASMVGLVSGMAHELNTPLGIMVTSISQLEVEIDFLFEKLHAQQLSRKDFQRIKEAWELGHRLLGTNLQRSVELVNSFKSLSMHNDTDEIQIFSIKLLVNSIADTFMNKFKSLGVELKVEIEKDILLNSYQWVLIEILSQLINNSLTHGFAKTDAPCIDILIQEDKGCVEINYSDNGCGSKHTDQIFDLFYTTQRGTECTGLGLPIVYNQVVHKLLGTISCAVDKQQGLAFNINIPITIVASNNNVANLS